MSTLLKPSMAGAWRVDAHAHVSVLVCAIRQRASCVYMVACVCNMAAQCVRSVRLCVCVCVCVCVFVSVCLRTWIKSSVLSSALSVIFHGCLCVCARIFFHAELGVCV